ncbi:MAG: Mur ligase family protein [Acidobacteriota bacterium]
MNDASAQTPSMHIHLVAIGGTGMAPLACLLQDLGHRVTGSDGPLYPPMSDLLADAGIDPLVGFGPQNLDPSPDLVIIGNAVPRTNPEAVAAEEAGLELISMPQALSRFLLSERKPLVVAGTHGKTTTTSWATWVWHECGRQPGYLIGGVPLDLDGSFAVGGGERFVIEGDEYNAAYFDREAKFLHYQPETLIVTNVEFDHADLYADEAAVVAAFRKLIALLPESGTLVACTDSPNVRELAPEAPCRVVTYAYEAEADVRPLEPPRADALGTSFCIRDLDGDEVELRIALWGEHNVANALAVYVAARTDGLSIEEAAAALGSFRGVKRRLEELGVARSDEGAEGRRGVVVVDDFAHHPTEIGKSLHGLKERYPGRRVVALFEPRSLTAGRTGLEESYLEAFARADAVLLAPVFHAERLGPEGTLDLAALAARLEERGILARACASVDGVRASALEWARPGDVLATMSSGSFEGLPRRLLAELGP